MRVTDLTITNTSEAFCFLTAQSSKKPSSTCTGLTRKLQKLNTELTELGDQIKLMTHH